MGKVKTTISFDPRNAARLDRCKKNGVTKSDVVNRALDEFFQRNRIREIAPDDPEDLRGGGSRSGGKSRDVERGPVDRGRDAPNVGDANAGPNDGNDRKDQQSDNQQKSWWDREIL